jgi:3-hexulose-6-phosphate synthase/6-phospho-3-hexuloisomerase
MSKIKLQIALDFLELPRAISIAELAVAGGAEYIEAGTPLIKSEGLGAVRALRKRFPGHTIIADMKTMDAGRTETEAAANAGANVITVSGTAALSTIRECIEAGRHYGITVAVDLLGVEDKLGFSKKIEELGAGWINIHCPIDAQMEGRDPLADLYLLRPAVGLTITVAGGINSETAAAASAAGADVVIVGGAITKAKDPRQATADIRKAIDTKEAVHTELFKRASADTIMEILRKVSTPNISDAAHRLPSLEGIRPIQSGVSVCGRAVTVRTLPGDWAKPVEAIDLAGPGDIIVIDACGQPPAIWGELATESAKVRGITGVVINGAARDTPEIRKLGFPLWTKYITANAGDPHGHGEINEPIVIAGQRILPGDWIACDDDGVMVIPKSMAVEITNRALDVLEKENRIREEIRGNKTSLAKVLNLLKWEKQDKTSGGEGTIVG